MFLITYSMSTSLPKNDLNRKNLSKVLQVGKVELESNKDFAQRLASNTPNNCSWVTLLNLGKAARPENRQGEQPLGKKFKKHFEN